MQIYDTLYKDDLVEMLEDVDILIKGYFYSIDNISVDMSLIISDVPVSRSSVRKVIESITIGVEYSDVGEELNHIKVEFPSHTHKTEYSTKEWEYTRPEHTKYITSRGQGNIYKLKGELGVARQKFCISSGFIHKGNNVYRLEMFKIKNSVA